MSTFLCEPKASLLCLLDELTPNNIFHWNKSNRDLKKKNNRNIDLNKFLLKLIRLSNKRRPKCFNAKKE